MKLLASDWLADTNHFYFLKNPVYLPSGLSESPTTKEFFLFTFRTVGHCHFLFGLCTMGSGLSTGSNSGEVAGSNRKLAPIAGRRRRNTHNNRRSTHNNRRSTDKDVFLGVEGDHMKTQSEVTTMKDFNKSARELFRLIDLDLNGVLSFSETQR